MCRTIILVETTSIDIVKSPRMFMRCRRSVFDFLDGQQGGFLSGIQANPGLASAAQERM